MSDTVFTEQQASQRLQDELPSWQCVEGCLQRDYACNGWRASVLLFNAVAHVAEAAWHHPDVLVSWGGIRVRLMTHDAGGITDKDFALAAQIEQLACWQPEEGSALEGTPDEPRWRYREPC